MLAALPRFFRGVQRRVFLYSKADPIKNNASINGILDCQKKKVSKKEKKKRWWYYDYPL